MADRLKEIPAKILEWWNKFTTRQKSIIIGAAAVVIFAFAIIMYVMTKPQYVRLITCETTAQASEIISTLDSAGIGHRESNDGLKIDVESSKQSAANLALGSAGYMPDELKLSDYLGNSMSTTATDKERLYNSYLEKYITQTIEAQSAVKSAKVHLSFPKDNGTLAAQKEEASAFIQLELDGTFTSANAAALAKCVATWLRNDTTANITIMDTDSNLLFAGGDDYSSAGIANSMQELQNQAESMIANQVKKVLLGTKQYNDAAVTSHLSMDFSDYEETVKNIMQTPTEQKVCFLMRRPMRVRIPMTVAEYPVLPPTARAVIPPMYHRTAITALRPLPRRAEITCPTSLLRTP